MTTQKQLKGRARKPRSYVLSCRCLMLPEGMQALATGLASYSLLQLVLQLLRIKAWVKSTLPLTFREAQGILFAVQVSERMKICNGCLSFASDGEWLRLSLRMPCMYRAKTGSTRCASFCEVEPFKTFPAATSMICSRSDLYSVDYTTPRHLRPTRASSGTLLTTKHLSAVATPISLLCSSTIPIADTPTRNRMKMVDDAPHSLLDSYVRNNHAPRRNMFPPFHPSRYTRYLRLTAPASPS